MPTIAALVQQSYQSQRLLDAHETGGARHPCHHQNHSPVCVAACLNPCTASDRNGGAQCTHVRLHKVLTHVRLRYAFVLTLPTARPFPPIASHPRRPTSYLSLPVSVSHHFCTPDQPFCGVCATPFTLMVRRQRCAVCGESVCAQCSSDKRHVEGGRGDAVWICCRGCWWVRWRFCQRTRPCAGFSPRNRC